jgi:hypothetical protein
MEEQTSRNKGSRMLKQQAVFKERLKNHNIDSEILESGWGTNSRNKKIHFNCYRTTGKPCSCASCSPGKVEEKAKYKLNKFKKFKYYEED